ncbi:MAG: hypothetical protein ACI8TX_002669 [Hyphomicrobiaceae bacterium]
MKQLRQFFAAHWSTFAVVLSFLLFAIWLVPFWSIFEFDPDEGGNLAKAALAANGLALFRDIWSDQPPLVTWLVASLFWITGPSIVVARCVILGFASLLVGLLFALLKRRYGLIASLVGVGALVLSLNFVTLSVSFMIGLVSVSLYVAAVCSLMQADQSPSRARVWLLVSGLLCGLSLAAKLFTLPLVVLLGVYAVAHHARRSFGFFAGLAVVVVMVVVTVSAGAGYEAFEQVTRSHVVAFDNAGYDWRRRIAGVWENRFLLIAASAGSIVALLRRQWLPVAWFAYGLAVILLHQPFFLHHFVLSTVPAAWLVAIFTGAVLEEFRGPVANASRTRAISRALLTGALVVVAATSAIVQVERLQSIGAADAERSVRKSDTNNLIVATLRANHGGNPWVLTDRPMFAIRAGLLALPELAVFSKKRMGVINVDSPDLFSELVVKYRSPQVVLARHQAYPPSFLEELQRDYKPVGVNDGTIRQFAKRTARDGN